MSNAADEFSKLVFHVLGIEQKLVLSSKYDMTVDECQRRQQQRQLPYYQDLRKCLENINNFLIKYVNHDSSNEMKDPVAIYLISLVRILSYCISQTTYEIVGKQIYEKIFMGIKTFINQCFSKI